MLATYQHLVNKNFHQQIDKNIEAYDDELPVKSRTIDTFIVDLKEVFQVLQSSRMMLNPEKCIFSMKFGKFLGHMVSFWGIKNNLDKDKAIQDMVPLKYVKDVHKLTGQLAALNRFLSKFA